MPSGSSYLLNKRLKNAGLPCGLRGFGDWRFYVPPCRYIADSGRIAQIGWVLGTEFGTGY